MTRPRSSLLLSEAIHEVQAADHALHTLYPVSRDPKVLLSCVAHAARALDCAAQATGAGVSAGATADAVTDAAPSPELRSRLSRILEEHSRAATVFSRGDRRVIASDDFAQLLPITPADVAADLDRVKSFVHDAGRRVMLGGSP